MANVSTAQAAPAVGVPALPGGVEVGVPIVMLDGRVSLYAGDCIATMNSLPENSVDSIVCDPPYHLTSIVKRFGKDGSAEAKEGTDGAYKRASAGFMGRAWDGGDIAFRVETWAAAFRVLKPGGYILAFASTRGFGRMSVAIEEAGFITHPLTAFLTEHADAQEFLSMLSKPQMDALLRLLEHNDLGGMLGWLFGSGFPKATRIKAEGYDGFRYGGQALKPAIEPIFMGQKPFSEATGTANILHWGTGAVNVDGCRVGSEVRVNAPGSTNERVAMGGGWRDDAEPTVAVGRWPANIIHDGSDEVVACFPEAPGQQRAVGPQFGAKDSVNVFGDYGPREDFQPRADSGSSARFFYSAKADATDRMGSKHPTVKPVDLMQWLCRLVTPPGGTILDPFSGSGSTGEAAWREGFNAILCEREPDYIADIQERMRLANVGPMERRARVASRKAPANNNDLFSQVAA